MNDEEALVRRALAAGERWREEREAEEQEGEREWQAELARREAAEAAEELRLKEAAATKLEEILGHRTSPHDWEIRKVEERKDTWPITVTYVTITLLGVLIYGKVEGQDIEMEMRTDKGRRVLTRAFFGDTLEQLHGEQ